MLEGEPRMSRSRSTVPAAPPSNPPAGKRRLSSLYRVLFMIAVLAITVVFVFPLVFEPRIDVPTDLRFSSPSSLAVQISNENLTPLTDVEYGCETSKITLANGSEVSDARVLTRGSIRKIPGRRAIIARCQTAYLLTAPLKAAEYKLTITYRASPWRRLRTSVFHIAAQFDKNNQMTAWKIS
jgi:hypothetical protein